MAKYGRNINVKKYSSIEEIYDSVNNDPKRSGFQIVYLEKFNKAFNQTQWVRYLRANGYNDSSITIKTPRIGSEEYYAIIIPATPEQATALKICF
jgi:adenylate cyclase class IV